MSNEHGLEIEQSVSDQYDAKKVWSLDSVWSALKIGIYVFPRIWDRHIPSRTVCWGASDDSWRGRRVPTSPPEFSAANIGPRL